MNNYPNRKPGCRLRIIVLGYIVRGPLGGLAWHHLQYVMGLSLLGHEVYFVEDSDDYEGCYNPQTGITGSDPSYGLRFAEHSFKMVELQDRWAYYDAHTLCWHGPCAENIMGICEHADVLLNVSGVNPIRPWFGNIPIRVLIDTDPAFTQIRHLNDPAARQLALKHNVFLTFAENFGTEGCVVPDDGLPWQATRQPVVLQAWPVVPAPKDGNFTTVMQWDSYKVREHNGIRYGMKSSSFEPYLDLPRYTDARLELAVGSETAPRKLLKENGWLVCDPLEVTRDLNTYRQYIQRSKAEFSIAKHGYVVTRSGWFSERSANYLASGRPVLVQETGFSSWMNSGAGVIAFNSPDEAIAGIEQIYRNYALHCEAARAVAEAYFDSSMVLTGMIECAVQTADSGAQQGCQDTDKTSDLM
jgi:hypothetical protein